MPLHWYSLISTRVLVVALKPWALIIGLPTRSGLCCVARMHDGAVCIAVSARPPMHMQVREGDDGRRLASVWLRATATSISPVPASSGSASPRHGAANTKNDGNTQRLISLRTLAANHVPLGVCGVRLDSSTVLLTRKASGASAGVAAPPFQTTRLITFRDIVRD